MAFIYEILNDINNKVYVGKTEGTIEKRFREHCQEALKKHCEKRPLYSAMRKYGIEHFFTRLLEETDFPEEREVYWIAAKHAYTKGYNATQGGDGKKYLNYKLIIDTYNELQNVTTTAKKLDICVDTVRRVLRSNNIVIKSSDIVLTEKSGKPVDQFSLDGVYLNTYPTTTMAALAISSDNSTTPNKFGSSHIAAVCRGKRKTAYGYIWKYKT